MEICQKNSTRITKTMLSKLTTQLMIDNYSLSARQAAQSDKPKLAIHYFFFSKRFISQRGLNQCKENTFHID